MLYSCTHMATVGFKGLKLWSGMPFKKIRPGQILYETVSDLQYGNNKVIATDV